jgi:hypothetical protein
LLYYRLRDYNEAVNMRAFRWGWSTFVVLATSLPYLIFWLRTPPGNHYSWIIPPFPEDSFAYMAWSQQAAHGSLLFKLKFTALPHSAFLFHPFFLLSGWLAVLSGANIGAIHWVLKAIGIVLFYVVFYTYIDWLRLTRFQSVVASVLVGVCSGFGGLFSLGLIDRWHIIPADLGLPEMTTYWSLLWNPLFPYSLALIVLIIFLLDRGSREARKRDFLLAGLATGVLTLIHPYSLPMLFTFAVIVTVARQLSDAVGLLLCFFSISLPFTLYVILASLNPLISQHSALGVMKSPNLLAYALGFGLPLVILIAGLALNARDWIQGYWQLVLWFILSLGFAYLPFWFQRKLIFGAQIPLCVLAAIILDLSLTKVSPLERRAWLCMCAAAVAVPLLIATPIFQLVRTAREVEINEHNSYYIPDDVLAGLNFLKERTKPDEVVFATWETSRLIPAYSGNTVLWGHWAMSVDAENRKRWYASLFNATSEWQDPQRSQNFWGAGIQYIFADGELEQSIEQNPERWLIILASSDKVFANSSVAIYKHRTM